MSGSIITTVDSLLLFITYLIYWVFSRIDCQVDPVFPMIHSELTVGVIVAALIISSAAQSLHLTITGWFAVGIILFGFR